MASSKEEKSTQTKELVFCINKSNYVKFLQSILDKPGQGHFKISKKKHFLLSLCHQKPKGQYTTLFPHVCSFH